MFKEYEKIQVDSKSRCFWDSRWEVDRLIDIYPALKIGNPLLGIVEVTDNKMNRLIGFAHGSNSWMRGHLFRYHRRRFDVRMSFERL